MVTLITRPYQYCIFNQAGGDKVQQQLQALQKSISQLVEKAANKILQKLVKIKTTFVFFQI